MKKIGYILLLLMMIMHMSSCAQERKWQKWGPSNSTGWGLNARIGYSIGGTTPLPIPVEIRKIETYSPKGGLSIGVEAYKMFNKRWGLRLGFNFANQGFSTRAQVMDYYTKIIKQDGNTQQGWYTGKNATDILCWTMVIPVMATFRISPRWNVSAGPYLSVNLSRSFDATVSDGYLRVDEGNGPTGTKTDPGTVTTSLGGDMRTCGMGLELGFDWKAFHHFGLFGKLDWGVTSIFPNDYQTVSFKMYPIYGTIGAFYSF